MAYSHPEIETGIVAPELELMHSRVDLLSLTTSVNLLQVHRQPKPNVTWNEDLDHDSLLRCLETGNQDRPRTFPVLQVIFLGVQENHVVQVHPSTLSWLQEQFAVSMLFLECIINVRYGGPGKPGSGYFYRRNTDGKVLAIDGFYQYYNRPNQGPAHVWFSHNLLTRSSLYIVANGSRNAIDRMLCCALGQSSELLIRPCAADAFLADAYSGEQAAEITKCRDQLLTFEEFGDQPQSSTPHAIKALHRLSQRWHIVHADLVDFENLLECLLDVRRKYNAVTTGSDDEGIAGCTTEESSVDESLTLLMSRNRIRTHWVVNYNERTKIRINLFFNLAFQCDNQANLEIANLTSQIAITTQRDSSYLLINLWRGKMPVKAPDNKATWAWAVLQGGIWEAHGKSVADATPHLPGSFDHPPRNPSEKISSGYKAWEFLTYIFVLGPGLLYGVLPNPYFKNFCKLVQAVRILHQRKLTREELLRAHALIIAFVREFEEIYYQRKPERIHFCRPVLHVLLHLAPLVHTLGPLCYYTQWMMERTIGNLTEEMKQPSQPFANLSQRGVRRAQTNVLKSMIPELNKDTKDPYGSEDIGDGYILLRAKDDRLRMLQGTAAAVVREYMHEQTGEDVTNWNPLVCWWARLRIPTGQIARSSWKEKMKPLEKVRISRNVRHEANETIFYSEIQFFFQVAIGNNTRTLALVSDYSPPNLNILRESYETIWTCRYQGAQALQVIDVKDIGSVVAMVPFPFDQDKFFVGEKIGLEVTTLSGIEEEDIPT